MTYDFADSPEVRAKESNIVGELGEAVSLACLVEAYPPPTIIWRRDKGQKHLQRPLLRTP
jgi:Immunoglobulin domain